MSGARSRTLVFLIRDTRSTMTLPLTAVSEAMDYEI